MQGRNGVWLDYLNCVSVDSALSKKWAIKFNKGKKRDHYHKEKSPTWFRSGTVTTLSA